MKYIILLSILLVSCHNKEERYTIDEVMLFYEYGYVNGASDIYERRRISVEVLKNDSIEMRKLIIGLKP
jgi:hypothetical protein